ncbi:hypothetical protein [Xanthomonas sp. 3307]|uniref:hypothetical protein n=1 Tax=Xanthomonas sp. 3307 TaxID=3035316 RepID=UPI0016076049|nr:hypothetical protein [Xanthomonas sp. 3307]MBB5944501.1 hypothetical protein [Xanthomonas sp. 3307]
MKFINSPGYVVAEGLRNASHEVYIGGRCTLPGALSPNTGAPLTQFARVVQSSEGFAVPGFDEAELHFLYSWKCDIHRGDFSYKYINGSIEVVEYTSGSDDYEDFPYPNYPEAFDEVSVGIRRLSEEEVAVIGKLNAPDVDPDYKFSGSLPSELSVPQHQFGGVPYLLDAGRARKVCPACKKEMTIIASVGNKNYSTDEGFVGNDFVQILYFSCSFCKVISALNFSD